MGKASSSHTHDDRYYTETEVNTLFNNKLGYYYTREEIDIKFYETHQRLGNGRLQIGWDDVNYKLWFYIDGSPVYYLNDMYPND